MSIENPSAFPFQREHPIRGGGSYRDDHPGMTLRDWFAGQALAGLMHPGWAADPIDAPEVAYRIADAMLASRAKSEAHT